MGGRAGLRAGSTGPSEVTRVIRSKLRNDNRLQGWLLEGPDRWEGLRGDLDIVGAYDQG